MLWHIQGTATYVLGSVHVTNMRSLQFSLLAEQAFADSSCIVFETDLDVIPDLSMFSLPSSAKLPDLIPEPVFRSTHTYWIRLGLPESRLFSIQPGFAAMTLQLINAAKNGYTPLLGVDRKLWERAGLEGKERRVLELFGEQLRMLSESPLAEQISLLDYIASKNDAGLSELAGMVTAWSIGDTAHFDNLLEQRLRFWPQTFEVLITRRNMNWAPIVAALARSGTACLIVVGSLHLFGSTGLPSLLRDYGLNLSFQNGA